MSVEYRDFSRPDGTKLDGSTKERETPQNLRWWELEGQNAADAIGHVISEIDKAQASRTAQILSSARLYGNIPMMGLNGVSYSGFGAAGSQSTIRERMSYNVVQSVVDTVTSKMAKNKPKPYYLTSGGSYKAQSNAKKRNKLITGIFFENDMYRMGELAFRDGAIWGDGPIKVFEKDGRVVAERRPCHSLYVDQVEAFYGKPRQMHEVMSVDRQILAAMFKRSKDVIEDANPSPLQTVRQPNVSDAVMVRESWHLASGPKAKDGKHIISIGNAVLYSEAWEHDWFPFANFQWCPRLYGFWAQGLAEQLQTIQLELNKLLLALQVAYQRAGLMVWLVENGSKIVKAHIDNEIARIISYSGTPPSALTPPVVAPEIYQQIDTLIRRAYDLAGISQLSAAGEKPMGIDSGKALRTLGDIENDRFTTVGKQYERFYLDIGKIAMATAKDIAERDGHFEAVSPERSATRTIKMSADELGEEDGFVMQCFPVSALPDEPAERFQTVQEWVQAGWYSPDQGKRLMDFPDLEQLNGLENAMEDRLQEVLDAIADDGDFAPPEPYWNLNRAGEMVLQYIVLGESQDLEPERLELLRRFRDQVLMLQAAAMPPPMMGAPGAPGAAALPLPPPQSPLLPNAPGAQA